MTQSPTDPPSSANWQSEVQSAHLYRIMADVELDPVRRQLFAALAGEAEAQAGIWARNLGPSLPDTRPNVRTRLLGSLIRLFGVKALLPMLAAAKVRGLSVYRSSAAGHPMPTTAGPEPYRHRALSQGGTLRAAVFGVNDGLVSNTSLVLGMAGAANTPRIVLLAGLAGLLAGAFSMAAGEYISMRTQRELFEKQIALEREELALYPEEEAEELALIYAARGFPIDDARHLATRLIASPAHALDILAREELGLNPDDLGSPYGAALFSFVAFAMGGVLPLLPYLLGSVRPVAWTVGLSVVALFSVGASLSLFTGRSALWSGARMVLIGLAAGGFTYFVGSVMGVSLS
ncbi:MAG: VIT1/CCC1 transporter family protein [Candidatus Sericytochromatia bacterium]|nr:VIT1/CCC1 transporter family protein [Candidatus Sericytochromatia bacterium]